MGVGRLNANGRYEPITPWVGSWAQSGPTISAQYAACYIFVDGLERFSRVTPTRARRLLAGLELGERSVARIMQFGKAVARRVGGWPIEYVGEWQEDASPGRIDDPTTPIFLPIRVISTTGGPGNGGN